MQEFFDSTRLEFLEWIKSQWGITCLDIRTDIEIQGSPERALSRAVFQDQDSRLFLIEKFTKNKFAVRDRVARAVDYLNARGFTQALAPLKTRMAEFLPFYKGACFQISPFLSGTLLKRPDYLDSSVMGKNFAKVLIHLSEASKGLSSVVSFPSFSIIAYIEKLFYDMKTHDRSLFEQFFPVLKFLESGFFQIHNRLPICFCHGDIHPLNIIWENHSIKAVIDWEFAGMKPDLYDAANLVGCAGIENPSGLGMDMVMGFLKAMKETQVISKVSWQIFPEYILALRFAWLSEWLRKKDHEMIDTEYAYMRILMDHMKEIKAAYH